MHVEINLVPPLPDGKTIPATLVADAGDLKGSASVNLSGSNVTADITVGTLSNMVYTATPTFKWKFIANTPSGLASNEFDQTTHTIYVTYGDPISDGGSLTPQRLNTVITRASGQTNIIGVASAIYAGLYNDKQAGALRGCLYVGPFAKNFAGTTCTPINTAQELSPSDLRVNWYMYSPVEPGVWDTRGACITFVELHNLELQILGINSGTPVDIMPVPDTEHCGDILQNPLTMHPRPYPFVCSDGNTYTCYWQFCASNEANNFEGALQVVDGGATTYYAGAINLVRPSPSQVLQALDAIEYELWADNGQSEPADCSMTYCGWSQACVAGVFALPPNCP